MQFRLDQKEKVIYCRRCVVSNQRPRITIDEDGVCSACRHAERKYKDIDWEVREAELIQMLDKHRSKDGSHDVIVPVSGGKDSGYVAHQLKYVYGMNPLTVTWSPIIYTDIGWKNLRNFIDSGFDNIMGTPNGRVNRILTRLSFEYRGDPFQPFVYGAKAFPLRMAVKHNIPLVMYGEDGEVEYGGSTKNANRAKIDLEQDLTKFYFSSVAPDDWVEFGLTDADMMPYMLPSIEDIKRVGVEHHHFSYYKKWVPQENYYYAVEHAGFEANSERSEGTYSKYASLDDRLDGFHYYLGFVKFGLGRATSDAAHEIRDGHLTREEGVALVRRYDGEFPGKYYDEFLEFIDISQDRFWEVVDSWRTPHLWEELNGEWKLKYQVS